MIGDTAGWVPLAPHERAPLPADASAEVADLFPESPEPSPVAARQGSALSLAAQGFAVSHVYGVRPDGTCRCPAGAACSAASIGKHGGTGWLEQATRDPAVIRTRFLAVDPGYGLVPLAGSGRLVVDEDVPGSLEALGPLPATFIVRTGLKPDGRRGRHVYGILPPDIAEADIPYQWAGGEVRIAGNGQVIGPYCRHRSGVLYEPVNDAPVAELPEAWVRAVIASGTQRHEAERVAHGPDDPGWRVTAGRHVFLVGKARNLRGVRLTGGRLLDEITRLDRERCDPPLADEPGRGMAELRKIAGWTEAHIADDGPGIIIHGPNPVPHAGEGPAVAETITAANTAPTIGTRTALDLRHGDAPPQLAGAFLTSEGPTVLYARGGTGKGLFACWLARQLVGTGHVVMVVDYEGHELEWGSRLRRLGLADDELERIHYRAPFAADWTAKKGSLWTVADAVRDDAARLGVTYLIVDSYSVATSNGDTMGGEAAAREYFSGLARIGLPSLTIAHVRGDSGKFPERPFGSVFVHNLARETWAAERIGDDDPEAIDPDEIRLGPDLVALELRNRKANARPKSSAQFVTFSFFADGTIEVTTDGPAGRSVADLAADALADGPLTLAKIAAAIKEDTGQSVSEDALRVTLKRHSQRFEQTTAGRPRTWNVR
jgi:hypothetical protein